MLRITFLLMIIFSIGSCSPDRTATTQGQFSGHQTLLYGHDGASQTMMPDNYMGQKDGPKTLALLLPLTGRHADIGQDLLNAAQLALFDMNDSSITLLPIDTKGTANGAEQASRTAIQQQAQLIIGPLLADSVRQAGNIAYRYNRPVIGFTTDARVSGGQIFTMGILPDDQGVRLANYAAESQLSRIIVIDPKTDYTRAVLRSFENTGSQVGLQIIQTISVSPRDNMEFVARRLEAMRGQFDAIFMPLADPQLSNLSEHLVNQGMGANIVPWLGTGLWDEPAVIQNPNMRGAIFSAPPTSLRQNYDVQYRSAFNNAPSRLSSLAYDATALGIILLKQTPSNRSVSPQTIRNPNGFAGIDGIFRFQKNGQAERGLAIHRIIGRAQVSVISPAQESFMQ